MRFFFAAVVVVFVLMIAGCGSAGGNKSKESVLRNSLFTLRTAIDEFTHDKRRAPRQLRELIDAGYLRRIPIDPMTGTADSWRQVSDNGSGIFDVQSGSSGKSLDGRAYAEW